MSNIDWMGKYPPGWVVRVIMEWNSGQKKNRGQAFSVSIYHSRPVSVYLSAIVTSPHSAEPRVINVDKNAAYPPAMAALKKNDLVGDTCKLRQVKYLNNIVEQDHRFIKRRVASGLGFASFLTADRTLRGYETMNMIRKGQIKGVKKEDITGQVKFIENLFDIAA